MNRCTCHSTERFHPCMRKYAYSECRKANRLIDTIVAMTLVAAIGTYVYAIAIVG